MEELEPNKSNKKPFTDKIEAESDCTINEATARYDLEPDAVQQVQEDSNAKCRIKEAQMILQTVAQKRCEILKLLKQRESEKVHLIGMVTYGEQRLTGFREAVALNNGRLDTLKLAHDRLSFANKAYQHRVVKSSLVSEEFNYHNAHTLLQHGSKSLAAEKQILRETKRRQKHEATMDWCSKLEDLNNRIPWLSTQSYQQSYDRAAGCWYFDKSRYKQQQAEVNRLKCTREDVIANASVKDTIWKSLGSKDQIKEKINTKEKESEDLRTRHLAFKQTLKHARKLMEAIEKDIDSLKEQLREATVRRAQAYEFILKHHEPKEEKKLCYCEHFSLLNGSGDNGQRKDAANLEDLLEVDKFMSKRRNSEAFNDNYWKYLSSSVYNYYYYY